MCEIPETCDALRCVAWNFCKPIDDRFRNVRHTKFPSQATNFSVFSRTPSIRLDIPHGNNYTNTNTNTAKNNERYARQLTRQLTIPFSVLRPFYTHFSIRSPVSVVSSSCRSAMIPTTRMVPLLLAAAVAVIAVLGVVRPVGGIMEELNPGELSWLKLVNHLRRENGNGVAIDRPTS